VTKKYQRLTVAEFERVVEERRRRRRGSRSSQKFLEELFGLPWPDIRRRLAPEPIQTDGIEIEEPSRPMAARRKAPRK
jgi:hypothetical protein